MKLRWMFFAIFFPVLLAATGCGPGGTPTQYSDFTVLAQSAEDYAQARPGQALTFPRDHGAHPGFRIEWWYLTANLESPDGKPFGAQWTLFRLAVQPPQPQDPGHARQSKQVYMGHFAITTPETHVAFQRYSRGGGHDRLARSGVEAAPFAAWLDDWVMRSTGTAWLPMEVFARQDDYSIRFVLDGDSPLVLHGDAGFSQKHPNGGGSYYYSQPFLAVNGELEVAGKHIPVTGQAWLDREWSSQFLQGQQEGWDWFSLHLENGEKLTLFQLRQSGALSPDGTFRYGLLMRPDGGTVRLDPGKIKLTVLRTTPVSGRQLPLSWRIELPQLNRTLDIKALHPDQWMDVDFPYWEGAITASGEGPSSRGLGYMDLTGNPMK